MFPTAHDQDQVAKTGPGGPLSRPIVPDDGQVRGVPAATSRAAASIAPSATSGALSYTVAGAGDFRTPTQARMGMSIAQAA